MTGSTIESSWGLKMAKRKRLTGSGKLHKGKLPARVLECVCSWDMNARDLSEELHVDRSKIWRALANLRRCKFIEDRKPSTHNKIVVPTAAGRAALAEYCMRLQNVET